MKKLGILFSGGKDSVLAAWLTCQNGYEVSCLISIQSENKESFMFHTPSISNVEKQAEAMGVPIIVQKTLGEREVELKDLEIAIDRARKEYAIEGVVTGAVESVYQATRVQKICNKLELEVFNPLWQKPQEEILDDLIKNKFEVIVVGVFAYPLTKEWLGKKIDKEFIDEIGKMKEKFQISVAGEGGEFETLVIAGPNFKKRLVVDNFEDSCDGENSCRREVEVK